MRGANLIKIDEFTAYIFMAFNEFKIVPYRCLNGTFDPKKGK